MHALVNMAITAAAERGHTTATARQYSTSVQQSCAFCVRQERHNVYSTQLYTLTIRGRAARKQQK